ncbi:MAG: bacillithiol biosynthesis deacetylase BshB1 [Saprospiraceae bacterium]|jgi:bacillithiol biosynthesis deacetylase BshB1
MIDKLDILAFAAHPDDVELAASGTLLAHKSLGCKIGIVDLTRGELGTRGSAEIRKIEAQKSTEILGLDYRTNLQLKDGFFEINEESLLKVIQEIRLLKPSLVLANSLSDRHPDHKQGAELVAKAFFLAGLSKIETFHNGIKQEAYRPNQLLHYIQDHYLKPDVVMDISKYMDLKIDSINAFSSQFYQSDDLDQGVVTPISGKDFKLFLDGRARQFGRMINVEFGEGFNTSKPVSVKNLLELL